MNVKAYEIDMLDVGNADAILLHYMMDDYSKRVVLVDAGNKDDGKKILKHMKQYYDTTIIDLAICTHPDNDHIGGFEYLLDNATIREFWINDPKALIDIEDALNRKSQLRLENELSTILETLQSNINIVDKIKSKVIIHKNPIEGLIHSELLIQVLGPDLEYYKEKLNKYRDIDIIIESNTKIASLKAQESLSTTLDEEDDSSSENQSSVIFAFYPDEKIHLFPGDAGCEALERVIKSYNGLKDIKFLKVPHHGSKKNLNSEIITHLSPITACISSDSDFYSQATVNALKKCGANVYATKGSSLLYNGMGTRIGYTTAKPL